MIVVDASVVIDLLLDLRPWGPFIGQRLASAVPALAAPHLLDAEVAQVLRRYVLRGELEPTVARAALRDLCDLPVVRYDHGPLLGRAFQLRDNVTVHDALYLVLAEALGWPLLTRDRALAEVPGHDARVQVLA
jgi:predicted nucleic acid-binding protein